jgi:hypothetical protein
MGSEQELIEKLMISKKIMDKHNNMGRGQSQGNDLTSPMVEEFTPIKGQYNLPQEFLSEESKIPKQTNNELPTSERILNSRLPDEIKRLMMEHPIQQPTMGTSTGSVLSNELIEKATRLMNNTPKGETNKQQHPQQQINESVSNSNLKDIIRETMEDVLKENGLLVESETNSNDLFKFRVGEHIFEGKILRVKKVSK